MTYKLPKREIKFRAWNEALGKMEYDVFPISATEYYRIDTKYDSILKRRTGKVLQYTGLKDSNGKEVYEGDVIKYFYPAGYTMAVVKFGYYDNGKEYEDRIAGYGWYLEEIRECRKETQECWEIHNKIWVFHRNEYPLSDYRFRVVGNVFQNPELLTQTYE